MDDKLNFEEAMENLEKVVNALESEDVPLEKAIDLFQEGVKLSAYCSQKLEQVEKKIEILINEDGQRKPFHPLNEENQGDLD
ncbi:exodeoxyribonuclease VII small subunit [Chengkuizengella axinellae]|uniref:Exodeoxyribonuclease 7 small subunit n=1 Tax=Chengkuizengella axinellae TaxID=3064388 RepID=A0ABT9IW89_9BACL|nr:exodeoxyribonuclease VII small subunit [Chengkuizengella sp. 2205SS18-9]MDP5273607.1 exodeoxyribonuclease VII small subunit [Chengkuizengella sp. 2205SS18-9]